MQHQFERALERSDVTAAIAAAKQMGGLSLGNALALCVVLAERDPERFPSRGRALVVTLRRRMQRGLARGGATRLGGAGRASDCSLSGPSGAP